MKSHYFYLKICAIECHYRHSTIINTIESIHQNACSNMVSEYYARMLRMNRLLISFQAQKIWRCHLQTVTVFSPTKFSPVRSRAAACSPRWFCGILKETISIRSEDIVGSRCLITLPLSTIHSDVNFRKRHSHRQSGSPFQCVVRTNAKYFLFVQVHE